MSPAINLSMGAREWGMLLILSILWGGSFYFVGVAVNELPTFTIVFLRVGIAALGLHLILRIVGERMPASLAIWRTFFIMGFLNNLVPFSLIAWGQSHIASDLASIILATTPLFTVVVAHFMTADKRLSGAGGWPASRPVSSALSFWSARNPCTVSESRFLPISGCSARRCSIPLAAYSDAASSAWG